MKTAFFMVFLFVLMIGSNASAARLYADADSTEIKPDFKNVNVVVEYEWKDSETLEKVEVYLHLDTKEPYVEIIASEFRKCEISIIEGITVKIFDSQTGKLLKAIKPKK
ncbi:MAG: hypothetical protein AB7T22_04465 [Calditrichaceae bacterium]